jgi:drug/metabolite transporter (DMT)-like permease
MALPPVIILPISYFALKERIGWQAVAGTILAIAGVVVLFLV